MREKDYKKARLPNTPGVYIFRDKTGKMLYIGKATSLADRVKSYFSRDLIETRGPHFVDMVTTAASVDFQETDSVLEALILEANLIKKHQPPLNTREKDDKSFNYLVITKEDYPRVRMVRALDLDQKFKPRSIKYLFGPFPHGAQFKEALRIVRKIFPFFDTPKPVTEMTSKALRGRLVFNQTIGLYPKELNKKEYAKTIQHIKLFFEGKKKAVLRELEKDMKKYAKEEAFEKAGEIKRKIFALNHIRDVSLLKRDVRDLPRTARSFRIEAYDIAHLSGKGMTGVMVVVESGAVKKSDYRKFRIKSVEGVSDTGALREILNRRFSHEEWRLPNLVVVDGSTAQMNVARDLLSEIGLEIPVVGVVKDEKHRPRKIVGDNKAGREHHVAILLSNSEAHRFAIGYHRTAMRRRRN